MRKFFLFTLLLLLVLAGWLAYGLLVPLAPGGQKFVMLRPGYSTRRIARELKSAGVIRSRDAFVLWHSFHRHPSLKAGEYLFDRDASVAGCEFGDGVRENRLLGFGRECVRETQPVWTRLGQREAIPREDESGRQKSNLEPLFEFQCCSHSAV